MKELTQSQKTVLVSVFEAMTRGVKDIILTGASGTGKTTVAAHILHSLEEMSRFTGNKYNIVTTATTNQAADVIAKDMNTYARTVYKELGLYPENGRIRCKSTNDVFNDNEYTDMIQERLDPDNQRPVETYLIVDEFTYVHDDLLYWLLKLCPHIGFIFIGDADQLLSPQVKGTVSPVMKLYPEVFTLTEQHRCIALPDGSNPIRDLSLKFKDAIHTGEIPQVDLAENIHLIEDEGTFLRLIRDSHHKDPRVIAYTNERVSQLNPYAVKTGTVHKAQGSSSDVVFMDLKNMSLCMEYDSISTFNRLMYVGVSRARKELFIYYED